MRVLGIDVETTGLDPTSDRIIEVGAVLWDTDKKYPLYMISEYIHSKGSFTPLPKDIVDLTGITDDDILEFGVEPARVFTILAMLIDKAKYVVAHNGTTFDKPFIKNGYSKARVAFPEHIPWIDTKVDVPYMEKITSRKLIHLAAEHGFLNPFAHRAVFDVLTMLNVLSHYDINYVAEYSQMPNITVRALVSIGDKEKAKARNYFWDGKNKFWLKVIKEKDYEKEAAACDFQIAIIKDDCKGA